MPTWFVLVPRHTSTLGSILQPSYLVRQTLKLSKMATCLYMPISRRRCTLLYVLDFPWNSLFDLKAFFSIVTPDNCHTAQSNLVSNSFDEFLRSASFHFPCSLFVFASCIVVTRSSYYDFRSPKLLVPCTCTCMLTVWLTLQVYLLCLLLWILLLSQGPRDPCSFSISVAIAFIKLVFKWSFDDSNE